MEQNNFTHQQERPTSPSFNQKTIELSIGAPDPSGKLTLYKRQVVRVSDVLSRMITNNYSPIIWAGDYRSSANFEYATGFCVDIDQDGNLEKSIAFLADKGWNYALSTTKRHTADLHRYRILLPFSRRVLTLADYKRIAREISTSHFPNNDPNVLDGARQLYHSPPDAFQRIEWARFHYDVDLPLRVEDGKANVSDAWPTTLEVTMADGRTLSASAVSTKEAINCPFHDDESPSAFIQYSEKSENWFIFCSSCKATYWRERPKRTIQDKCARFYSYRSDIHEASVAGGRFSFSNVGREKFFVWTEAFGSKERETIFAYLVRNKHIPTTFRVDNIGEATATRTTFSYDPEKAVFEVHHPPLATNVEDNEIVEKWLESLFGKHTQFIKRWLAAYCYTNYQRLPTLVLKGARGTGKNTFAEALMTIYPAISQFWHGEDKKFTPEVTSKLLIADESVSSNEKQYRLLKQRSGQKFLRVNQKYEPEYQVRNNVNIIIMSNDHTPVFVRREELPTDQNNNQFFVYEFPKLTGPIDPKLPVKIEARLGYYIRTVLKDVFQEVVQLSGCRYMIPTPITDEEKALFDVNVTGLEAEADKFLRKMAESDDEKMIAFFGKGLFPNSFIDLYTIAHGYTKNGVIRNLKERGFLEPTDPIRKMVNGPRQYCYQLTKKAIDWLDEERKKE